MKLKALRIAGFRSFKAPQELDLTNVPPGLYLVSGENQVEPELGGNGAGKSSLFEALYWADFGKTSRGLKAGNVRSWTGKSCAVEAEYEEGTVLRTWNPNELLWNGTVVDQATLEQELRLSPETSLSTFFFSQTEPFFLDLSAPARMDIYAQVLALDFWDHKSDQAKALAREAEQAAQALAVEHARLDSKVQTLQQVDYSSDLETWDKEHTSRLLAAQRDVGNVEQEINNLAIELDAMVTALVKANKELARHRTAMESTRSALTSAQRAKAAADAEVQVAGKALQAATQELQRFKELGVGECPECGQQLSSLHKGEHTKHLKQKEAATAALLQEKKALAQSAAKGQETAELAFNKLSASAPSLQNMEQRKESIETSLRSANSRKFNATKNLGAVKKEVNPFRQLQETNRQEIKAAAATAAATLKELNETRELQARFEFWIKGFKDVRFQIIQESLTQLNAEANECLHQLGLQSWGLEFAVERETKSGGVKRGFICNVLSPYTEEAVPWEAWSGGESQRLRLAGQLGISNLLCARLGHEFDFEFWDEPSNWLNAGGINSLLQALRERAQRYGKRIFIADHRAFDFDFDGELKVVKTDTGSSFLPLVLKN